MGGIFIDHTGGALSKVKQVYQSMLSSTGRIELSANGRPVNIPAHRMDGLMD
jgi:hypothetical protein